jgi:hypothetical protein
MDLRSWTGLFRKPQLAQLVSFTGEDLTANGDDQVLASKERCSPAIDRVSARQSTTQGNFLLKGRGEEGGEGKGMKFCFGAFLTSRNGPMA